jgi:site-specific DNA-cytosine methylase
MTLITTSPHTREIRHFHLFCGLGGGAKGFNRGFARVGNLQAKFRCIGGIDSDPAAIKDFHRLAGVPGTLLDMFSRDQYRHFHGAEPPPHWREATPADIHVAAGNERPHLIFLSAPCKGFSGLLSETKSKTDKYQALNALTLRGMWLALEAYKDDPSEFFVFENVPRIATRGRHLLDQITALLQSYGYAVAETTHDCGELGGLAQSRKRFLLVARHIAKVPPFLYEPDKRPLRAISTVLGRMPLPGDTQTAGAMHRLPRLNWKTWVRLAFVEAGSDWRSLNKLAVEDGMLRDYCLMPDNKWDNSLQYGVNHWEEPTGTIAAKSRPGNGRYAVADPRGPSQAFTKFAITNWSQDTGTVIGGHGPSHGAYGVADPRPDWNRRHNNMPVIDWDSPAKTIHQGGKGVQGGALSVADPRIDGHERSVQMGVRHWDQTAPVVTGKMFVGGGPNAIADPRIEGAPRFNNTYRIVPWADTLPAVAGPGGPARGLAVADPRAINRVKGDNFLSGGHYGIIPWEASSGAISAAANHDNGRWSLADPRIDQPLPAPTDKLTCVIRALDSTWHRPFTTLELAALQSLVDPEEHLELQGLSDNAWRERVGNAVPPKAAEAIASVMGTTLLLAWSGETFLLSNQPIWVRPVATALAVQQPR